MYKIRTNNKIPKRTVLIATIVVVALALAGAGMLWRSNKLNQETASDNSTNGIEQEANLPNTVDYSPATPSNNDASEERKNNPSKASSTLSNGATRDPDTQPAFSVAVTRAGKDTSNQNVQVAALVEGATSGTCTVTLSKSGQAAVQRQTSVELQSNSYVCPVITIPLGDFPQKGNWNVSVSVASGGKTATADWAANPIAL